MLHSENPRQLLKNLALHIKRGLEGNFTLVLPHGTLHLSHPMIENSHAKLLQLCLSWLRVLKDCKNNLSSPLHCDWLACWQGQCLIARRWSLSNRKQSTCVGACVSSQLAGAITSAYIILADTLTRPSNTTAHHTTLSGRPRIWLSQTVPYVIIHHQGQSLARSDSSVRSLVPLRPAASPQAQYKLVGILFWNGSFAFS